MKCRIFPLFALACAAPLGAESPPHALTITVAAPKVVVAPLAAGRQFVTLPDLKYLFLLEPRCDRAWQPQSVSLSIADSRLVFAADALDAHGFINAQLAVPAAQLAPLPVSGFCEATDDDDQLRQPDDDGRELRIGAAVSAHASLLCVKDDAESITYVSRPLAVTLRCHDADNVGGEPPAPVNQPTAPGARQETPG